MEPPPARSLACLRWRYISQLITKQWIPLSTKTVCPTWLPMPSTSRLSPWISTILTTRQDGVEVRVPLVLPDGPRGNANPNISLHPTFTFDSCCIAKRRKCQEIDGSNVAACIAAFTRRQVAECSPVLLLATRNSSQQNRIIVWTMDRQQRMHRSARQFVYGCSHFRADVNGKLRYPRTFERCVGYNKFS